MANSRVTILDLKVKTGVATEIRDSIELYCSGSTYGVFLEKFIPVFLKLLEGQPVFVSTSPEQVSSSIQWLHVDQSVCLLTEAVSASATAY